MFPVTCANADGCCPAHCNSASDTDCSAMCGDGIVQAARGETCERNAIAETGATCPSEADCVDSDPCTRDLLTGSADNCNAACTHTKISALQGGDACCPAGANANTDSDCKASCGNGVREGSEECDGTAGCNDSCKLTVTSMQADCLARLASDECERCECTSCTNEIFACAASGNTTRDSACSAVEECAIKQHCSGDTCYCGTNQSSFDCGIRPQGPCTAVIQAAAGTSSGPAVQAQGADPNTALGRATVLGDCRRKNCSDKCP
jgi:hypothetical protein